MCIAIVITGSHRPTRSELERMHRHNSDGAGVGWADGGKTHWLKGLTAKDVDEWLDQLPRPVLVHFRYATVGGAIPELTHPFPVSRLMPSAVSGSLKAPIMIHNGHWGGWERYRDKLSTRRKLPPGAWSDTRMAAYLMAFYPEEVGRVANTMGGKVAVLRPDGSWEAYGGWTEDKGVHYSNTYWKSPPVFTRGSIYSQYFEDWGMEPTEVGVNVRTRSFNRTSDSRWEKRDGRWHDRWKNEEQPPYDADHATWSAYLDRKYPASRVTGTFGEHQVVERLVVDDDGNRSVEYSLEPLSQGETEETCG